MAAPCVVFIGNCPYRNISTAAAGRCREQRPKTALAPAMAACRFFITAWP